MASVADYFGCGLPQKTYGRKTNSGLLIGIEVELEKLEVLDEIKGWNAVRDGSLKDNGMEFTLPVWNTYAEEYLKELFGKVKAEANSRCSVHIHADVTTFTVYQMRALIALYIIFEKAFYRYSGNRWDNIYCVPVRTWAVGMTLKTLGLGDMALVFQKYSGLNVFPDEGKLGTVEFRHMAGNKNPAYITAWITIITKLVQYAKQQDFNALLERVNDMRATSQYWDLAKEIFDEDLRTLNYPNFDKDVEEGITFLKLITE